jgi:hypothetical protein
LVIFKCVWWIRSASWVSGATEVLYYYYLSSSSNCWIVGGLLLF